MGTGKTIRIIYFSSSLLAEFPGDLNLLCSRYHCSTGYSEPLALRRRKKGAKRKAGIRKEKGKIRGKRREKK